MSPWRADGGLSTPAPLFFCLLAILRVPAGLRWLAEGGDAQAQHQLAECLWNGWGGDANRQHSLALREQAATNGYALAHIWLGDWHHKTSQGWKDKAEQHKQHRLAARHMHRAAAHPSPWRDKALGALKSPRLSKAAAQNAHADRCEGRRLQLGAWVALMENSAEDLPTAAKDTWIPDNAASECMGDCGTAFAVLTNRRHHCRFCGLLACKQCLKTPSATSVAGASDVGVACVQCREILNAYEAKLSEYAVLVPDDAPPAAAPNPFAGVAGPKAGGESCQGCGVEAPSSSGVAVCDRCTAGVSGAPAGSLPTFDRAAVALGKVLRSSSYGKICAATLLRNQGGPASPCVVKQPGVEGSGYFAEEIKVNANIMECGSHANVVAALGCVRVERTVSMLVLEHCLLGSLGALLKVSGTPVGDCGAAHAGVKTCRCQQRGA